MKIFVRILLVLAILLLPTKTTVSAASSTTDLQKQLIETQKKQAEIAKQKQQKEADAAQLNALIKSLDKNIGQASTQLKSTGEQLDQTVADINEATDVLQKSEIRLTALNSKLEDLIGEMYKMDAASTPVLEIVGSPSLSDGVEAIQYRSSVNSEFENLVDEETATRDNIATAKASLEQKKGELTQLKEQQTAAKLGLQDEQQKKNRVLASTNSVITDLKKEMAQLEAIEKDVEAQIQARLRASYGRVNGGLRVPIKKGGVIGYQGNTGNSTGSHLHFSVFQDCDMGKPLNPLSYLGGRFVWPLSNYRITQGYGVTSFSISSGFYRNGFHNGIDLADHSGAPIKAVADGNIILRDTFGAYGKAAVIDHGNGICTLYGHMMP